MLESISQNWLVRWGLPYLYSVNWSYLVNVGLSTNITSKKITCKGNPPNSISMTRLNFWCSVDSCYLSIADWPIHNLWNYSLINCRLTIHSLFVKGEILWKRKTLWDFSTILCSFNKKLWQISFLLPHQSGLPWQYMTTPLGCCRKPWWKSCHKSPQPSHKGVRLSFGSVWPNPRPMQPEFHWFQNCFWSIPTLAQ